MTVERNPSSLNFMEMMVEEIALEGLDGITLPTLWLRLEDRKDFPLALDNRSKAFLWQAVVSKEGLSFYMLKEPRPDLERFDRHAHICPVEGAYSEPKNLQADIYPVEVINKNGVVGSCSTYETRTEITSVIRGSDGCAKYSYADAIEKWDQRLTVVASQTQRHCALTGGVVKPRGSALSYCFLERIGRSRYNGVTSIGAPQLSFKAFSKAGGNKGIFSLVKSLMKQNYVLKQTLVRKDGNPPSSNLVHLKRFYRTISSQIVEQGQKLCDYLESKSQPFELTSVVKKHLGVTEKQLASVVRVCERLVIEKVSPSTLLSDGEDGDSSSINLDSPEMVSVVKLIKGESHFGEDEDVEDASDDEDDGKTVHAEKRTEAYKWKHEDTFIRQVYQMVSKHGIDGMTQHHLQICLGLSRYTARSILRYTIETGLFHSFVRDVGKHRTTFYVTKPMMELSNRDQKEALEEFKQLTTDGREEEDNFPEEVCAMDVDTEKENLAGTSNEKDSKTGASLSEIKVGFFDGFPVKIAEGPIKTAEASGRMLRRAITLLNLVQKHKVIDNMMQLVQIIRHESPGEEGVEMCRKTLMRLIDWCCREGKLQKYCVKLERDKKVAHMILVCANGIDRDHKRVKAAISQAKLFLFNGGAQKRTQLGGMVLPKSFCDSIFEWNQLFKSLSSGSPSQKSRLNRYGSLPKMQRAALAHKYLWYLVYGYEGKKQPDRSDVTASRTLSVPSSTSSQSTDVTDEVFQLTDKAEGKIVKEPNTSIVGQLKTPQVYLDVWDWRRYLPPLREHTDVQPMVGRAEGVCLVADLIMHMPACVFCQLISINFQVDGLKEMLDNKDLRLYPVSCLPSAMVHQMMDRRRSLFSFLYNCDVLCQMALLTYGPFAFQDTTKLFMYVHKNGTVYDTRASEPGYRYTRLPKGVDSFPCLTFPFKTMDDLSKYWTMLQTVTLGTPLYARQLAKHDQPPDKKPAVSVEDCTKGRFLDNLVEDSTLPGDQRGAGGVDSSLFLNLKRNWYSMKNPPDQLGDECSSSKKSGRKQPLDLPELSDTELTEIKVKKKKIKKQQMRLKKSQQERSKEASDPVEAFAATIPGTSDGPKKTQVKGNKGGKGIKRIIGSRYKNIRPGRSKGGKHSKARKTFPKPKCREMFRRDDVDEEALKKMDGERVKWSAKEMTVLLMGRVAGLILLPDRDTMSCPLSKYIRDVLHQRLPNLAKDKTQFACTRKLHVELRKNPRAQINITNYVIRAQMDKKLMAKHAPNIHPKGQKPKAGFFAHFKSLLNDLLDKFMLTEQEDNLDHLPSTMSVLKRDYQIVGNKKLPRWQDVRTKADVCKIAVRDMQMSHILSMGDKQGRMFEMYSTLRQYPDSLLRDVFDRLMQDKLITRPKCKKFATDIMQNTVNFSMTKTYSLKTRAPAAASNLFVKSCQLFDQLLQMQTRATRSDAGQTQDGASRDDSSHVTLSSSCDGGTVACLITLAALKQASLKVDIPLEILNLSEAALDPRLRKRRIPDQLQSRQFGFGDDNDDNDFGETIKQKIRVMTATDSCDDTAIPSSQKTPRAALSVSTEGEAVCVAALPQGPTGDGRARTKRKRQDTDESSDDETTGDSPHSKRTKLSDADESSSFEMPECALKQYSQRAVVDEGDRCKKMVLDSVAIRFEKTPTVVQDAKALDSRGRSWGVSFTLISLIRMSREDEKDPRVCTKVDRFLINPVSMSVGLKRGASISEGAGTEGMETPPSFPEEPAAVASAPTQNPEAKSPGDDSLSVSRPVHGASSFQNGAAAAGKELDRVGVSSLLVDSEVIEKIIHRQQKLLPFTLDLAAVWKDLEATLASEDIAVWRAVYDDIDGGGMLGRTWAELQRRFDSADALKHCLQTLLEVDAVVRVGVTSWRYVSLQHARPWLICTLKNTRGRGSVPQPLDQACDSTKPAEEVETSTGDNNDSSVVAASNSDNGMLLAERTKGQNPPSVTEMNVTGAIPCAMETLCADMVEASPEDLFGQIVAPSEMVLEGGLSRDGPSPKKRKRTARERPQGCPVPDTCPGAMTPNSTYEKVRLLGRLWRKPEGHLHRPVLSSYLGAILWYLMLHPGCSLASLVEHFNPVFTPVSMQELLEILLELRCVTETQVAISPGPITAFSKRRPAQSTEILGVGGDPLNTVYYEATIDCTIRLGRFQQCLQ